MYLFIWLALLVLCDYISVIGYNIDIDIYIYFLFHTISSIPSMTWFSVNYICSDVR